MAGADTEFDIFDRPIGNPPPKVIDPVAQAEIDRLRGLLQKARAQLWREWVQAGSVEARQVFNEIKSED